jgi:hypothetical protein
MRLELKLKKSLFVLAIVSAALSANAATIFTTGADWKYIDATEATTFAGDTTGWSGVSYDDSSWYTGATLFGNVDLGLGAPATEWTAGYDAKVRKTLDAGAGIDGAVLNIAIDNYTPCSSMAFRSTASTPKATPTAGNTRLLSETSPLACTRLPFSWTTTAARPHLMPNSPAPKQFRSRLPWLLSEWALSPFFDDDARPSKV